VGVLHQTARGLFGVGIGTITGVFHHVRPLS
jgi:hypothetical protein